MDSNEVLIKLQDSLYDLLIDFDRICKQNNMVYYLSYGTLLGAVRHRGFIPWDDDIDVTMPREDYDNFIENHEIILPSYIELQHYKKTPNYHLNFAKIVNRNTTVVEADGKSHYKIGGAFIDIYPIDGVGNDYKKALRRRLMSAIYVRVNSWASYSKAKINSKSFFPKLVIHIVQLFINGKKLKLKTEKFLRKKSYSMSKYVTVGVGSYNKRKVTEKAVYGAPQKIKFRNYFFNAPAKIGEYLNLEYGKDYMELPPAEKRHSEHNIIHINLELPYKEFNLGMLKEEINSK